MNLDVIAEIVAASFSAGRRVSRRYSATVVLHAPDKTATRRSTGYGGNADSARISAIRAALRSWGGGGVTIAPEEVRVSSRTLPNGYGIQYLADADRCMALANLMPAESQAYKDVMAVAEWYARQYLAVRYEYLRNY